ncbi:tol-pal system YbgF family protein [Lacinutrix sp. Hel_I_90]|uniref:tetratricopeptide repeat protein n=1 Tax=Lacinutrix sp. Hel_I_90 TaxID=1249999 RepID=UPI0005CB3A18|nr:tetratricopeptide repeat protein [Lacinutrix sp. Hel_I_90]
MTNEDLLYHYFSNTLTEAQRLEFNKRLETNTEFNAEFEFESNLKRAIKHETNASLKTKLKGFESTVKAKDKSRKVSVFNWKIAASMVFLLGSSWFAYTTFFGVDYNDLYAANFQEYPNTEYAITRSDSMDSPERKAFVAYEAGDYENAVKAFERINTAHKKAYHQFYIAQAYLKLGKADKAKALLKAIVSENEKFSGESQWYLALIALKEKDKVEAIKQLSKLTENYGYNKSKAETLLNQLR